MKASIKFREDGKPLVRAKVRISIFGLPFLSGFAAALDDLRHLRFDLSTAFASGPSLRFSCRPNHPAGPFFIVLQTGLGPLGSPNMGAPISMAAEFGLLARPGFHAGPYLTILLKPRLGDFTVKKTVSSAITAPAATSSEAAPAEDAVAGISSGNELKDDERPNELPANGIGSWINGLGSGFEVSTGTVLPIRCHTAKLKWGLRLPPELRIGIGYPPTSIPLSKIPLLVMSKISIYHETTSCGSEKKEVAEAVSVMQQLEAVQAENVTLKKAVEELQAEASGWKMAPPAAIRLDGGKGAAKVPATGTKSGGQVSRRKEEVEDKTSLVGDADVGEELIKTPSTGGRT